MSAPAQVTNLEKVIDAIEHLLRTRLNHAAGYRTPGALVLRGNDPRILLQNKAAEYAEKSCTISIRLGEEEFSPKGSLGGVQRTRQLIQFWCLRSLTNAENTAGKAPHRAEADLRTDLRWILRRNSTLKSTACELHSLYPTKGYDSISCMNLGILGIGAGVAQFPNTFFVAVAGFEFDEDSTTAFL